MSYTQKIVSRRTYFAGHRHGGGRIPNFVRHEERHERKRRPAMWFASVAEAFSDARKRGHRG